MFVFIGASPHTDWLDGVVTRDEHGFLPTGPDLSPTSLAGWSLERGPYLLETNVPGLFAAGDVRQGSVKRVASAVGEGAVAVTFVHRYLAEV
jgi:thioredoxin reductase (NADPH)